MAAAESIFLAKIFYSRYARILYTRLPVNRLAHVPVEGKFFCIHENINLSSYFRVS